MNKQNTNKILSIFVVSILLGVSFDYFFFGKGIGIAFPIYLFLISSGLFVISHIYEKSISKNAILLLIPLAFFGIMIAIHSSTLLTFLNIIACILHLLLIADIALAGRIKEFLIKDYIRIPFTPIKFVAPFFKSTTDLFSLKNGEKSIALQIIKGVLISIPFLFIFILLFSSSDLIFQKYISDLVNIEGETIFRIILILLVSCIFVGAYSYIFNEQKVLKEEKKSKLSIGKVEGYILLGSVSLLFLIFIFIQITYLFGGESNISSLGFTYAQYARSGFFELIGVAVISFLLLLGLDKYTKRDSGSILFKVFSSVLVLEVIAIMISAFTRLLMYEDAYGLTTLRLYSYAFIIFLTVVFCLFEYKILVNTKENTLSLGIFFSVMLFLIGMNVLNPDAFIARRNIQRFNEGKKIDTYYLTTLSTDAIPVTIQLLDSSNEEVRGEFAYYMYWKEQGNVRSYEWQSLNISRINANDIIDSNMNILEKYKEYIENIDYNSID